MPDPRPVAAQTCSYELLAEDPGLRTRPQGTPYLVLVPSKHAVRPPIPICDSPSEPRGMLSLAPLKALDELLRGARTPAPPPADAVAGDPLLVRDDSREKLPLRWFLPAAVILGAVHGVFIGLYALGSLSSGGFKHLLACTVKLPMLFLLTLLVTFPSLYVFAALGGFKLGFASTFRLLVGSIAVSLTVGASLGPILGFFTLSTTSYPFIVLLNVALLGIAGIIGAAFLLRALRALTDKPESPPALPPLEPLLDPTLHPEFPFQRGLPIRSSLADLIFSTWVIIYAGVGLQMAWILRPFIGTPGSDFTFFRPRASNVFESILQCFERLF